LGDISDRIGQLFPRRLAQIFTADLRGFMQIFFSGISGVFNQRYLRKRVLPDWEIFMIVMHKCFTADLRRCVYREFAQIFFSGFAQIFSAAFAVYLISDISEKEC
jgi:hypothetical protein